MRDFFKQELTTLHLKTGLQQYFKLQEMEQWEKQFEILLNSLEYVCREFPYIPDEAKKKIISENILKDQGYTSLNPRVVYGWLNANKTIYWESQSDFQEITREPAPPEVADQYLEKWKTDVAKIGKVTTPADMNQVRRQAEHTTVTGKEYIDYQANLVTFICDGFPIPAKDERFARMSYKEAFGKEPEKIEQQTPQI